MLAGYLPFDDDPSNPDGDNINQLYNYILATTLMFPDYISADACDLLRIMLVPDPAKRCNMRRIMAHRWLRPYAAIFQHSIDDLEVHIIDFCMFLMHDMVYTYSRYSQLTFLRLRQWRD